MRLTALHGRAVDEGVAAHQRPVALAASRTARRPRRWTWRAASRRTRACPPARARVHEIVVGEHRGGDHDRVDVVVAEHVVQRRRGPHAGVPAGVRRRGARRRGRRSSARTRRRRPEHAQAGWAPSSPVPPVRRPQAYRCSPVRSPLRHRPRASPDPPDCQAWQRDDVHRARERRGPPRTRCRREGHAATICRRAVTLNSPVGLSAFSAGMNVDLTPGTLRDSALPEGPVACASGRDQQGCRGR